MQSKFDEYRSSLISLRTQLKIVLLKVLTVFAVSF